MAANECDYEHAVEFFLTVRHRPSDAAAYTPSFEFLPTMYNTLCDLNAVPPDEAVTSMVGALVSPMSPCCLFAYPKGGMLSLRDAMLAMHDKGPHAHRFARTLLDARVCLYGMPAAVRMYRFARSVATLALEPAKFLGIARDAVRQSSSARSGMTVAKAAAITPADTTADIAAYAAAYGHTAAFVRRYVPGICYLKIGPFAYESAKDKNRFELLNDMRQLTVDNIRYYVETHKVGNFNKIVDNTDEDAAFAIVFDGEAVAESLHHTMITQPDIFMEVDTANASRVLQFYLSRLGAFARSDLFQPDPNRDVWEEQLTAEEALNHGAEINIENLGLTRPVENKDQLSACYGTSVDGLHIYCTITPTLAKEIDTDVFEHLPHAKDAYVHGTDYLIIQKRDGTWVTVKKSSTPLRLADAAPLIALVNKWHDPPTAFYTNACLPILQLEAPHAIWAPPQLTAAQQATVDILTEESNAVVAPHIKLALAEKYAAA